MRVFISAGEASGDALGAGLLKALLELRPGLQAFGLGGGRMADEGFECWHRSDELSVVGLVEVLSALPRLHRLMSTLAARAIEARPDVAVLIDVPDFNIRLARRLSRAGIPVVFYVGPTVWAWRAGRARRYAEHVRRMLLLFPFEQEVWRRTGVDAVCVGHQLLDEIPAVSTQSSERSSLCLMPGSRARELRAHLPVMLEAAKRVFDTGALERGVLPMAPGLDRSWVEAQMTAAGLSDRIDLVDGADARRRAIGESRLAWVASGTATLETALIGCPQIVVYRVHWLSYWIFRMMIRVKHIGLVNLIAGREVAPELLQGALTADRLVAESTQLLEHPERGRVDAEEIRGKLGEPGVAKRAARAVVEVVS